MFRFDTDTAESFGWTIVYASHFFPGLTLVVTPLSMDRF